MARAAVLAWFLRGEVMKIKCESCKKLKDEKDIIWDLKEDREVCKNCYKKKEVKEYECNSLRG
jgi:NAD-dependent SIR2 family protein deacetylase